MTLLFVRIPLRSSAGPRGQRARHPEGMKQKVSHARKWWEKNAHRDPCHICRKRSPSTLAFTMSGVRVDAGQMDSYASNETLMLAVKPPSPSTRE